MFTATYPASFLREEDGKGFHVRFPDVPEALTGGDDLDDTLAQAADCLAEAIAGRIRRGEEIPVPAKPKRGQRLISVPLYLAPKLTLYLAMREQGMRNTELAKRLSVSETIVRRMLDPKHNTKPEKIQAALAALDKRIVVTFEDVSLPSKPLTGRPERRGARASRRPIGRRSAGRGRSRRRSEHRSA